MKLFEIMNKVEYTVLQGTDVEVKGIVIDSRKAQKGSLFFCIKGLKVDARKFVDDAAEQGAVCVVIDDEEGLKLPQDVTVLKVKNSREALAYAAASFFGNPSESFNVIGVTGTNGKTSTTYYIEAILNENKASVGVIGTVGIVLNGEKLNIPFDTSTTPDPIELHKIFLRMKEDKAEYVVMEATSHALALNKLEGTSFDVGVFTNLTQDHLDLHGTMENYLNEKTKLFKMCRTGVINADDGSCKHLIENAACEKIYTYSIENESDFKAENVQYLSNGVTFDVAINGEKHSFNVPVAGKISVYNALASIAATYSIGVSIDTIKKGIENMKGVPGRIQSIPNNLGFNVVVDYAHTPDGLENILQAVRGYTQGRIITVFGCGGDRDRTKRPIMGEIAGRISDYCVITSDNPRTEEPNSILNEIESGTAQTKCAYEKIIDRKQAIFRALELAQKGDSVVVAGKGHENYQIFADRTIHFDDCEVAKEWIDAFEKK